MFFSRIFASVLTMAIYVQGDSGAEMMVAFVCDRPAMHLADNRRWIKDGDVGCLRRPNDILNYCRKVYPSANVERIEESKEKETIGHWCRFGHVHCHDRFKVQPFRCVQAGADDVISSYISIPSADRQRKEQKQSAKAKKNFKRYHTKKISKGNKDVLLEDAQQTTDAQQQQQQQQQQKQQQQQQTVSTRLITRRQTAFNDFLASTDDRNAPALNVVRNFRRLTGALQRERIHAVDVLYTHRNREADFEGWKSVIATELQDVDKILEKAMRRLDKMKQRKKIKLQIEDDLDNYHEFDDVISSLLLTSTTTSTTTSPTTTRTTSQDDDDDDDDDIMDSNRGQTNVTESKITEKILEEKTNEEANDDNDYYDGEDEKYENDNEEHRTSEDADRIFPSSSAPSLVESKPSFFSRLSRKTDDDIVYDDYINTEGKRDANNFGRNTIRVKQSSLPKTSSRQGGKFDTALPLGISVSSLTVVVVIVVGIAVMRRRSRRHEPLGIPKANESRPPATSEAPPRHVTNLQTVGYENPTYRYFEMRSE